MTQTTITFTDTIAPGIKPITTTGTTDGTSWNASEFDQLLEQHESRFRTASSLNTLDRIRLQIHNDPQGIDNPVYQELYRLLRSVNRFD